MRACGIPAHFVVAGQISSLRQEIDELKEVIAKEKESILRRIESVPTDVVSAILENISVTGAQPITRADITQLSDTIIKKVSEMLNSRSAPATPEPVEVTTEAPPFQGFRRGYGKVDFTQSLKGGSFHGRQ